MSGCFPLKVFPMQAVDSGKKRRSSLWSDPAPPHHHPPHASLHPFLHPHPCLFSAITIIIPVIYVTQSSNPVISRKSACCECDLKKIPPNVCFSWRLQYLIKILPTRTCHVHYTLQNEIVGWIENRFLVAKSVKFHLRVVTEKTNTNM